MTKNNLAGFVASYPISWIFDVILFFPPAIFFYITGKFKITLPDPVWYITIIYIAFAWSYSVYIEVMFCAELYLWHHKWDRINTFAKIKGHPALSLSDITPPRLFDNIPDLNKEILDKDIIQIVKSKMKNDLFDTKPRYPEASFRMQNFNVIVRCP